VPGGLFEIDADSGAVLSHLQAALNFGRVAMSPDGERLYGIVISGGWSGARLVEIDRGSGDIVAEQNLESDVWNIAFAAIPENLVPRGYIIPGACTKPLQ
jgi:hypothetical protein